MTRRDFLGFFLLGGLLGFLGRKISDKKINVEKEQEGKMAMFWRKKDEV